MAAGKEDPRLRAAYNAAVKKYGSSSQQALNARSALQKQRASVGLGNNASGIGKGYQAPGAAGNTPPGQIPPNQGEPAGPGTADDPTGGVSGGVGPNEQPPGSYAGYPVNPGPDVGKGSLGFNPLSKGTPGDLSTLVNQGLQAGVRGSVLGEAVTNPNVSGPLSQTTFGYGPDGRPVQVNRLSQGNQNALNSIQQTGLGAEGLVGGFLKSDGTAAGDKGNPLSALQQASYNRLTGAGSVHGIDETFKRDQDQLAQTLANRGIPVGSQLYNQQMQGLQQDYNLQKQNAMDSSTQQSFSQLPTLQNIGQAGYVTNAPQFQQFAPTQFNAGLLNNPLGELTSQKNVGAQVAGAANVAGINAAGNLAVAQQYAQSPAFQGGGQLPPGP